MSRKKKIILAVLITIVVIAGITAALLVFKQKNREKKVAAVYAVSEIGHDASMYGYDSTISGNVAVNMEQKVYVSSNQKVEEICVKEGDTVKAGDVLLVYDTTAQNLQLEIVKTELELARVAVISAEQDLEKLKNTTPVEPTTEQPTTEEPTTEEPTTEEPTTEEPTTEEPTTEEPTTEEPTTEEPTTEEPTTEESTTEEPTTEEQIPGDNVTKEPVVKNAVSEPQAPEVPGDGENPDEDPNEDPNEIKYTKEELKKAIADKENEIKQLRIDYQLKQISYEIMEYQNSTGEVLCNFDGVVKSVIDEDTAATENQPIIVIGGEDGYTVESSIGELSLLTVRPGDTVSLFCYDTGMSYEGIITEISDLPTNNMYNYSAKTESFYPMKIAITDASDLRQGMYMEITMNQSSDVDSNSIYLPMAFVMRENSRYYVMKETDGVLKKVYLNTGKMMYGDTIEVKSGVTMDDYIAFPYMEDAKEGVKTEHKSSMDLYN